MVGVNVCDNLRVYLDVPYLVLSVIWVGGGGVGGGGACRGEVVYLEGFVLRLF